jgi:hypothetical protein
MVLFAVTRWPGFMPWNFSTAYAMMFCAGVYFPKRLVWWLPFTTMLVTDLLLNLYYHAHYGTPIFSPDLIGNYVVYGLLVLLGRKFSPRSSFLSLLSGGILGAILFYFVTNTLSWFINAFQNPEYTKNLVGWLIALTRGTTHYDYPIKMETWQMFRNTLGSGGLFTALFVGAMKLMGAFEPAEEKEESETEEEKPTTKPEEAKA